MKVQKSTRRKTRTVASHTEEKLKEWESGVSKGTDKNYDPDVMFAKIKASDQHGHGVNLQGKVHPRVARLVSMITEGGVFPISTQSDFVRHAVHHYIDVLKGLDPNVNSFLSRIGSIKNLLIEEEMNKDFETTILKAEAECMEHVNRGRGNFAKDLAKKVKKEVDAMPNSKWKEWWQQEAQNRLGRFM